MNLSERIARANTLLSPHATPHEGKLGRPFYEPLDDRFPFARDRDRIRETNAFRKLAGKTQVFVAGVSHHYRNRMTHTLEVSDASRNVCSSLGLNEYVAEAIALVHDIGHPPFGHQGEEVLDFLLGQSGEHFNHNLQGFRTVTLLERPYDTIPGLNLNHEVTNGMLKNGLHHPETGEKVTHVLEAKVVDSGDRAAYVGHDTQDGLKGDIFSVEQLSDVPLCGEIIATVGTRARAIRREIFSTLLGDLKQTSYPSMWTDQPVIRMSDAMAAKRDELYAFLKDMMYSHPKVHAKREEGQNTIVKLFHAYKNNPPDGVLALERLTSCSRERAVADFIAGMDDAYLMQEGAKIA